MSDMHLLMKGGLMLKHHMDRELVGGLEHEISDFPYIGNVIIPTDGLIFFRGVETTKQIIFGHSEAVTSSPHGTF
jgi:hypothetical protein